MGSSHSKVAPLPSENVIEKHSSRSTKTTGTGCWAGIKKLFSRNTKVFPLASESDADDDDEHSNDDDVQLLQTATTAPVVPAPAVVKPAELHRHSPKVVHSDPIGQKHMPIISQEVKSSPVIGQKFVSGRPSTSHPADVRVSSGYFLYYHRYLKDSDNESSDEDTSDEYVSDADVESADDEQRTTAPKKVVRRHRRSAHSGKKGKKPKNGAAWMKGKKAAKVSGDVSSDNETSHVTSQRTVVKKDDLDVKITVKVIEQTDGSVGADAISDDEATSQVATASVAEKANLFFASMSVVFAIIGVFAFVEIAKGVENEKQDDDEGAVVETQEAEAPTHPEPEQQVQEDDYESDFESYSETDPDQPSTSYRRDKHATYDFLVWKRFVEVDSDEYIW